jgi:translation initiation factor IF-3
MNRVIKDCEGMATPEAPPRMMGRSLLMLLTPVKKTPGGKPEA